MRPVASSLASSAPPGIGARLLRRPLAFVITLYQRHLSPHKGYRCAHRALHGNVSCSEYARQAVLHHDLADAVRLTHRRFAGCYAASRTLASLRFAKGEGGDGKEPPREGDAAEIGRKCFLLPTSMCCISGFMFK